MPRYFFDVTDGLAERDSIGTELAIDQVMRAEALKFIECLLSEEPIRLGLGRWNYTMFRNMTMPINDQLLEILISNLLIPL